MSDADVVVVGAGSAGCAVAATLVHAGLRVTLLEAGPSTIDGRVARHDARDCDQSGRLDWGYTATTQGGRRLPVPRGRVLGGTSAINTCVAIRPDPDSFERWSAFVGGGWAWNDVIDDFRAIEHDVEFGASPNHGATGPLPIVRWRDDELVPVSAAFLDACVEGGHLRIGDLNEPGATGVGMIPMNRWGRERASGDVAFLAALEPSARTRLDVVTDYVADRLVVDGRRVRGIDAVGPDGPRRLLGEHTVLCAGSYGTPAILQRSGLGPATHLRRLGIDVVEDLPVGEGLHDHPMALLMVACPPADADRPAMQVLLKTTTAGSTVPNDMQLTVFNRPDPAKLGLSHVTDSPHVSALCLSLQHSEQRGRVRIGSSAPDAAPDIVLEHLAHPADLERARWAVRELARIGNADAMGEMRSIEPVAVAGMTDDEVDELLVARARSTHHPMGTAAMAGPDGDGVVDRDLRVRGVDGLSVADASVIPLSLNANIHLVCTMIGRRHGRELASAGGVRSP